MNLKLSLALFILSIIPGIASAERLSLAGLQAQINQLTTTVNELNEALTTTRSALVNTQKELEIVKSNTVLGLDGLLTHQEIDGQDTAVFNAVNLQVQNGTDATNALNGLGNLIVGYNANISGAVNRIGSHNIILGDDQSYLNTEEMITNNILSNRDLAVTVANNMSTAVGGREETTIGGSQTTAIGINQDTIVGANQTLNIGSSKTVSIGSNKSEQIGGMSSTSVGTDVNIDIGSNMNMSIANDGAILIGSNALFDAGDQLLLTTGSASQLMKKNGDITIEGKNIIIKGSGGIDIKATADLVLKGSSILQN